MELGPSVTDWGEAFDGYLTGDADRIYGEPGRAVAGQDVATVQVAVKQAVGLIWSEYVAGSDSGSDNACCTILSMMDILPRPKPLILDVRPTGSTPVGQSSALWWWATWRGGRWPDPELRRGRVVGPPAQPG